MISYCTSMKLHPDSRHLNWWTRLWFFLAIQNSLVFSGWKNNLVNPFDKGQNTLCHEIWYKGTFFSALVTEKLTWKWQQAWMRSKQLDGFYNNSEIDISLKQLQGVFFNWLWNSLNFILMLLYDLHKQPDHQREDTDLF